MSKGFNEERCYSSVSYFYDGTTVPDVLTADEAIKFLRLDDGGTQHPETTLAYYRSENLLRATQVGKKLRYLKSELLKFLDFQTQKTNGDIS